MNISTASRNHTVINRSIDNQVRQLEKQKAKLYQELDKITESEDEQKLKNKKVNAIYQQIQFIDIRINQITRGKPREFMDKEHETVAEMKENTPQSTNIAFKN